VPERLDDAVSARYHRRMRLALFQPDQPGNVGTLVRLGACLAVPVDVIEPCGFPFSLHALRRAGLDYADHAEIVPHADWAAFRAVRPQRLVLLTTKASLAHTDATFHADDILIVGQESAGAPDHVHAAADLRVRIPLAPGLRSLNVAIAAAMVLGEALRQTESYPA
jgi:tRNA (cytidine/uridine-2'-O-)-methyltransferase